jgi:D-alanine-D-alanine ligase
MKKAVILLNKISANPTPDELDVLVQASHVEEVLLASGFHVSQVQFGLDLSAVWQFLEEYSPSIVFNLVETVNGRGELIHLSPSLLETMEIPFTGSGSHAAYVSSHKILAKERFVDLNIPTAPWFHGNRCREIDPSKEYVIKPVWEDGSVGITDKSVRPGYAILPEISSYTADSKIFLEEYIPGREINISILAGKKGPEVLPAAEIIFRDYPAGKPQILNYASKWEEGSFEYINTIRSFEFSASDRSLLGKLQQISHDCWNGFGLKGYARVDFRIGHNNEPFVLEVNVNPCLSPDAGFAAASARAGLSYTEIVERIMEDAYK